MSDDKIEIKYPKFIKNNNKDVFLLDEFFENSWNAAVQRNQTYNDNVSKEDKKLLKNNVKQIVIEMLDEYSEKKIDDDVHYENIDKIITNIPDSLNQELKETKLKAATAQKVLNMMLKYCWCRGWIKEPPQMPIDDMNIKKLITEANKQSKFDNVDTIKKYSSWTKKIEDLEDYKNIIKSIRKILYKKSLAKWELENWKRDSDLNIKKN